MKELTNIYMTLQTAEQREAFWVELNQKMQLFTDEQKALFAISWSESLQESLENADETLEASKQARITAAQMGWTFPAE